MKNYKINLIKIGRNDVSKEIVHNFMTLQLAREFALKESSKYLMSSGVSLGECDEENHYIVFAGFRNVGKVIIKESLE